MTLFSEKRFVIHTVGPRYNQKYKTAAENALHNCYRNSLQILKENGLGTIGFCVINTEKRSYPREEAAHIAARESFHLHFPLPLQPSYSSLSS